jgi:4-amino-4-deoxy-L-arabinose transferase-like glycosyltransferase
VPTGEAAPASTAPAAPSRANGKRRFFAVLGIILLVATGVRVAYILGEAQGDEQFYDAAYYELQARAIVDGRGWVDPFPLLPGGSGEVREAADHPPLTVIAMIPMVVVGNALGMDDEDNQLAMRFEVMFAGLFAVFLIGLLGRELVGDRTGLIAAGIAAVYPYLWINDGLIMSEAFAAAAVTGALLLTLRLFKQPTLGRALVLGLVCGIAALARAELVLLAPLLGLPLFWSFRAQPWSRRFAIVGSIAVGTAILIGPWVAYNFSRFDEPTFLSTNDGTAMLASNCDNVFWGPSTGLTYLKGCIPEKAPPGDQSVVSRIYRERAIDYVSLRKKRAAVVLLARIGRDWSVFRPVDMLTWNQAEGRASWITGLGLYFYYPLALFAIGGIVVLKRRRTRQWPLLIPPIIVTLGSILAYGQTRFRVPAEPTIVVLAAVAITALSHRWWPEAEPPSSDGAPEHEDAPTSAAVDQVPESSTIVASSSS